MRFLVCILLMASVLLETYGAPAQEVDSKDVAEAHSIVKTSAGESLELNERYLCQASDGNRYEYVVDTKGLQPLGDQPTGVHPDPDQCTKDISQPQPQPEFLTKDIIQALAG